MPRIPCLEYHGHATAPQFRLDRVSLSDFARELTPLGGERQRSPLVKWFMDRSATANKPVTSTRSSVENQCERAISIPARSPRSNESMLREDSPPTRDGRACAAR
jgi:hypothetical protein